MGPEPVFMCRDSTAQIKKQEMAGSADTNEQIGLRLRRLRFAKGYTSPQEWADYIEVSKGAWLHYEAGDRDIPIDVVITLCAKTGVSSDWILLGLEHTLPRHVAEMLETMPADKLPPKKGEVDQKRTAKKRA